MEDLAIGEAMDAAAALNREQASKIEQLEAAVRLANTSREKAERSAADAVHQLGDAEHAAAVHRKEAEELRARVSSASHGGLGSRPSPLRCR